MLEYLQRILTVKAKRQDKNAFYKAQKGQPCVKRIRTSKTALA
jgi:hypothetical protein